MTKNSGLFYHDRLRIEKSKSADSTVERKAAYTNGIGGCADEYGILEAV